MNKLEELLKYQNKITELQYMINVLHWDLRISTPKDGSEYLINIISDLEARLFQLQTSKNMKKY